MRHISRASITSETPDGTTDRFSGINPYILQEKTPEQTGFLEKILDAVPAPVFFIEACRGHVSVNRAFIEAFGPSCSRIIEEITSEGPLPGFRSDMSAGEAGNGSLEFSFRHSDGTIRYMRFNVSPYVLPDGSDAGLLGVINDETRHKQIEDQLLHSQKMEAIGKLTGGIAHDFNNMIMAITGYATLVRSRLAGDDQTKHYIEQLMDVADRASNLTRRLLAFGRKQGVSLRPVSLNEIVQRAGHLISRLIGERVEFVTRLGGQNFTVMADSGQMEQLLLNLATNGRDAMAGSGTLTITTSEQTIDAGFIEANGYGLAGNYACLTVKDTGAGIDSETLKRIFDPFFTTKDVGKGTGLGLSIVYGIVKQHSGFITVGSVLNEGTEFRILLPTVQVRPRRLTIQRSMAPSAVAGKETVLLTEDDPGVREIARALLEESGYKVIEAVDGEDAVARFNENRDDISLLLFDVMMPRKNGKEAYDEIKKTAPWIKVLFFSGYSEEVIATEGFFDPGANFISKPVPPHLLLKKVRMILDGY